MFNLSEVKINKATTKASIALNLYTGGGFTMLIRGLLITILVLLLTGCTVESSGEKGGTEAVEKAGVTEEGTSRINIESINAPELCNNGESEDRQAMRGIITGVIAEAGVDMEELGINEVIPHYGLNINDISVSDFMIYEGEGTAIVLLKSKNVEKTLDLMRTELGERSGAIGNKGDYVYYVEGVGIEECLKERIGE